MQRSNQSGKDVITDLLVITILVPVTILSYAVAPRHTYHNWRAALRLTKRHRANGFRSKMIIFVDYAFLSGLSLDTKRAIEDGRISAELLEPNDPFVMDEHRKIHC